MTIPSTPRKAGPLLGTGAQTSWPFTFKVFAESDIAVTIANSTGVETALVLNTDYSVALNANQETSPGGTITYPISGTPLPVGSVLSIVGDLDYDQPLDLPAGGNFSPAALENELDRLTMQIQQIKEELNRSLLVPVTSDAAPSLPMPEANQLIGWDASGENLQNIDLQDLGVAVAYGTFRYDTFTGDGVTTEFTPSTNPATIANLDVAVDGLTWVPGTDYTLVSGVVVFATAPSNGAEILVRYGEAMAAAPGDAADISYHPAGTGAVTTDVETKLREWVSAKDFGAKGDGSTNDTAAINLALAAATAVFFPPGTYMTDGGHNIQGKSLVGFNRDVSIIKARGTNTGVTLFTGAQTNPSSPGSWGSGGVFRLENLGIHGNWNGTSGLTVVGSYNTGVLAANYNATTNTALVKGVSTVYTFIKNCYFGYAYEHAVMFYGNGYSEIDGNIFTTCRGSAIWMAGDKTSPATEASSTSTSTTFEDNQITTCRGGNGGLVMHLTYGCTVRGNLFEANVYGYNLGEGADCSFSGNYSELGYSVGDNVGIAPVLIDNAVWGYSFVGEAYNPVGNYLPSTPRSAVAIDRSGIRVRGTSGYGGAGIQFPATQAPSTDVNTLDDYEEGTWTPAGFGITFTSSSGKYTKIGNVVTVTFTAVFPTTADGNIAYITGLPFTVSADAGVALGSAGGRASVDFTYKASGGNTFLLPLNAAGSAYMTNANFSAGTVIGSVSYQV